MQPAQTTIIADTDAHSDLSAFCFQVLADAVVSAITGSLDGFSGVTIPAQTIIFANFTSITLASGTIVVYEASRA